MRIKILSTHMEMHKMHSSTFVCKKSPAPGHPGAGHVLSVLHLMSLLIAGTLLSAKAAMQVRMSSGSMNAPLYAAA